MAIRFQRRSPSRAGEASVDVAQPHLFADDASCRRQQTHERQHERRLATAALADDAQHFAAAQRDRVTLRTAAAGFCPGRHNRPTGD